MILNLIKTPRFTAGRFFTSISCRLFYSPADKFIKFPSIAIGKSVSAAAFDVKNKINRLLFFIFFLLCLNPFNKITPQKNDLNFSLLSIEQGLSQSTVFSILQDKLGFMWFGTNDGLNKYDGYKITVYKPDPGNPQSLSGNRVFTIFEDSKGELWIGTDGGLNKYDRSREIFEHYVYKPGSYKCIPNNRVTSIKEDKEGFLWIGTSNGLAKFDRKNNTFTTFQKNSSDKNSLSNNSIWAIYIDKEGYIWIGTDSLLNKFNPAKGKFNHYNLTPNEPNRIAGNTIFSITEDDKQGLWIATRRGLNRFDKATNSFMRITEEPQKKGGLNNDNIYSLFIDKSKNLWIGTLGGGINKLKYPAFKTKAADCEFVCYSHDPKNNSSINNNYIWSIYEDRAGALWIGTDIGINKYDPLLEKFFVHRNNPFNPNSLCSNIVTSVLEDRTGYLWIGTNHGLDKYDPATMKYTHYTASYSNKSSLSNDFIRSIHEDKYGIIWIGTNGGGLNRYDKLTGKFTRYTHDPQNPNSISDDKIISICEDYEGNLWLGTFGGLNKFNPKTGTSVRYQNDALNKNSLSHNYVFKVIEDSKGDLWIGTSFGLNHYDKKKNQFTHYFTNPSSPGSLSNNLVMSLLEDKSGSIWVGTNGGLNKYDRVKDCFYHFTEKDILSNDVIYGILEDSNGLLWLSTNNGLTKFNPRSKYIKTFTKDDGLQSNQFSAGAYFKNSRGKMYFGGISGMNEFYPDNITRNTFIPPIVITDFQISNKSINPFNSTFLSKSITETQEINLTYRENVFSFEFAAISYTLPQKNEYAYMMVGFDKTWIKSGNRRFVTYTNLDPGEYIFKVIGANNDGYWNTKGAQIRIIITPPFYKTWWFIILSAILVLSLIALVIYYRMKALLAIERIRFNIAADLHDDLGTHLTEISMLSDTIFLIAENSGKIEKDMVKKIGSIARKLIDGMNDIVWLINPKRDSLTELFIKIRDNFEETLTHSNILLHFGNLEFLEKIKLPMEYRKNLYLIFKEAMNNSVKHSGCSNIWVEAIQEGKFLIISLKDDGSGFDTSEESNGNGLSNMQERVKYLKGTLKIESHKNNGTEIMFKGKI